MKKLALLVVLVLSPFSFAEEPPALSDIDFLEFEKTKKAKPKTTGYYRELAAKETALTEAAMAYKARVDAGISLNEDGTWNYKKGFSVASNPVPTEQFNTNEDLETVSIQGIVFESSPEADSISTGSPVLLHVAGRTAAFRYGNSEITIGLGGELPNGEILTDISIEGVVLTTAGGPNRFLPLSL